MITMHMYRLYCTLSLCLRKRTICVSPVKTISSATLEHNIRLLNRPDVVAVHRITKCSIKIQTFGR